MLSIAQLFELAIIGHSHRGKALASREFYKQPPCASGGPEDQGAIDKTRQRLRN
jgi:hypothetical protein